MRRWRWCETMKCHESLTVEYVNGDGLWLSVAWITSISARVRRFRFLYQQEAGGRVTLLGDHGYATSGRVVADYLQQRTEKDAFSGRLCFEAGCPTRNKKQDLRNDFLLSIQRMNLVQEWRKISPWEYTATIFVLPLTEASGSKVSRRVLLLHFSVIKKLKSHETVRKDSKRVTKTCDDTHCRLMQRFCLSCSSWSYSRVFL